MASSIGKNNANTGTRIVPSPNPEKKVSPDAKIAVMQMTMYSTIPSKIKSDLQPIPHSHSVSHSVSQFNSVPLQPHCKIL